MLVRRAVPADLSALVCLAREFHAECTVYRETVFDPHRANAYMQEFMPPNAWDKALFVADANGVLVGFLLAFVLPLPFSPSYEAYEDFFYVSKAHRNGCAGAGVKLLRAYMAWARKFDPFTINVNVRAHVDQAKATALLERSGFTVHGHHWAMKGNN